MSRGSGGRTLDEEKGRRSTERTRRACGSAGCRGCACAWVRYAGTAQRVTPSSGPVWLQVCRPLAWKPA
jgi:hypothetical protein